MTMLERATVAFLTAIEEARTLIQQEWTAEVAELLRHAFELLDIVDEELPTLAGDPTAELATVAKAMRERLAALERTMTTRH